MICLTMSLPLFSQTAMDTDTLISLPVKYVRQIASELTLYDFCKQQRDSSKIEIQNINSILEQNKLLLSNYKNLTDSLFTSNEKYFNQLSVLQVDVKNKDEKINKLRNTRNITFITTLLTALIPVVLR